MKKKVLCIFIIVSFVFTTIPITSGSSESSQDTTDSLPLCHIIAKGSGRCITIHGTFFLGFGRCWLMIINLENDGYIEVTSLIDPSNHVVIEGSHRLFIVGFVGFKINIPKINVNGIALLASWN